MLGVVNWQSKLVCQVTYQPSVADSTCMFHANWRTRWLPSEFLQQVSLIIFSQAQREFWSTLKLTNQIQRFQAMPWNWTLKWTHFSIRLVGQILYALLRFGVHLDLVSSISWIIWLCKECTLCCADPVRCLFSTWNCTSWWFLFQRYHNLCDEQVTLV